MMPRNVVVVVEDEELVRVNIMAFFDEAGLEVISFETADEALALVASQPETVAAIFADIQTPGNFDGLTMAQVISRHWPEILVMLTSGPVRPPLPLPTNVRFVPKPWRPLEVLTAMQRQVSQTSGAVHRRP